jgi:hypothetical protein
VSQCALTTSSRPQPHATPAGGGNCAEVPALCGRPTRRLTTRHRLRNPEVAHRDRASRVHRARRHKSAACSDTRGRPGAGPLGVHSEVDSPVWGQDTRQLGVDRVRNPSPTLLYGPTSAVARTRSLEVERRCRTRRRSHAEPLGLREGSPSVCHGREAYGYTTARWLGCVTYQAASLTKLGHLPM